MKNLVNKKAFAACVLLAASLTPNAFGEGAFGIGGSTGVGVSGSPEEKPSSCFTLQVLDVGRSPREDSGNYGYTNFHTDYCGMITPSPVGVDIIDSHLPSKLPNIKLGLHGMGGYQLLGTHTFKTPVMLHLGLEPWNFVGDLDFGSIFKGADVPASSGGTRYPTRTQYAAWLPSATAGIEVKLGGKDGCRILGLFRYGAAGGGAAHQDGISNFRSSDQGPGQYFTTLMGGGGYVNCGAINVNADYTRIQDMTHPMTIINADAMYDLPIRFPLAVGVSANAVETDNVGPRDTGQGLAQTYYTPPTQSGLVSATNVNVMASARIHWEKDPSAAEEPKENEKSISELQKQLDLLKAQREADKLEAEARERAREERLRERARQRARQEASVSELKDDSKPATPELAPMTTTTATNAADLKDMDRAPADLKAPTPALEQPALETAPIAVPAVKTSTPAVQAQPQEIK